MHPDTDDRHYVRAVTALGDTHTVTAHEDIVSESGIKLVAKGGRIDSRLYKRLVQHKLLAPIDHSLSTEQAVDGASLAHQAGELLNANPVLQQAFATLPGLDPAAELRRVHLPAPLAFKLTVAREQQPVLYTHSLLMALISLFLGARLGLEPKQLNELVTAALLHDIGMLHLDPALFEPGHHLDEAERRQLYAHPLIAYLILKQFPELHPLVSGAVLHHHERLDGSGYPHGYHAGQISRLGQILGVAEVAMSRFDQRGQCQECHRLEVMLKLNTHKLDPRLVALLAPLYKEEAVGGVTAQGDREELKRRLLHLAEMFVRWEELTQNRDEDTGGEAQAFVQTQLFELRKALYDAGFNPQQVEQFLQPELADKDYLGEVESLLDESAWQLSELRREFKRRWPECESEACRSVQAWLDQAAGAG